MTPPVARPVRRRRWWLWLVALLAGLLLAAAALADPSDRWTGSGVLREEMTADPALAFYVLSLGEGSLLLTVDRDVPLARWLSAQRQRRIVIELLAGAPLARDEGR